MKNTAAATPQLVVTYTLTLTIKQAIDDSFDPDCTPQEHADYMVTAKPMRELEKEVLKHLRKLDGDCDVEVIDAKIAEE